MTDTTEAPAARNALVDFSSRVFSAFQAIPDWLILLLTRIAAALPFWFSARTKVEGFFTIKGSTYYLFEYEYALPIIPSDFAAVLATVAEHVLAVLLVIGLAARLSAAGLLVMTLVIQIFVYPGAWALHLTWFVMLLLIVARGPGALSVDHLLRARLRG